MNVIGIRFSANNPAKFEALRMLFGEIQHDKQNGHFRDPSNWVHLVPEDVKARFSWPTSEERARWLKVRDVTIIAIPDVSLQIGAQWDFYRVFEAIEDGDYNLLACEMVGDGEAEMRIDPHAYPYGGVGPLIALAEAFGFRVLGLNEFGKYQSRNELLKGNSA